MNASQAMWCRNCCAIVETIATDVAKSVAPTAMAALFGAATARKRAPLSEVLLRAGAAAAGAAFVHHVIVPTVQQIACTNCGCTHLSAAA